MTSRKHYLAVVTVCSLAGVCLVCGCGSTAAVESPATPEPTAAEEPAQEAVLSTDAEEDLTAAPQETAPAAKIAYTPPFPERETLFEPPVQAKRSSAMDEEQPNGGVMLLGFANVDAEKAVLSIDGVVTPLAKGGEYSGVRVITLAPPRVVLQRGRNRWTESIQ